MFFNNKKQLKNIKHDEKVAFKIDGDTLNLSPILKVSVNSQAKNRMSQNLSRRQSAADQLTLQARKGVTMTIKMTLMLSPHQSHVNSRLE